MSTDEEVLHKTQLHQLARDIVNETVAGKISNETAGKIAEVALPPLKRQWVRDQVRGIQSAKENSRHE